MHLSRELNWWKAGAYWLASWCLAEIGLISVGIAAVGIDLWWAPPEGDVGRLLGLYLLLFIATIGTLATLVVLPIQSAALYLWSRRADRSVAMTSAILTTVSSTIASALFDAAAPSTRLSADVISRLLIVIFIATFFFHSLVLVIGRWLSSR